MGKQKQQIQNTAKGENALSTFSFMLRMGNWKDSFTVEERKILLAEALNTCSHQRSHHHKMRVTGYLVTGKRLFLVMMAHEENEESILEFFYRTVREEIKRKRTRLHKHVHEFFDEEKHEREKPGHLFEKLAMPANNLVNCLRATK